MVGNSTGWLVSGAKGPPGVGRNDRDDAAVSREERRRRKAREGDLAEFFADRQLERLGDRPGRT
ncbi:MAG: hypothetical protein AVDCRST_MAG19-1449 [uncultured Thermomicrobiales bacterium]|uniref:Uncharacterized protein n=1 Tax=uncultured Thermomicrobiales bacterium TaxID=1645740 RepID=A0A6J4UUD2_9BACT|nr:MAG: hypothetical protein AVDCRST_MAG19-1449 [uncultured Thermomicrobiales bacterium]